MKHCTKCGILQVANERMFYRDSSKSDGLHSWCKVCVKKDRKRWRGLNPGIVRANAKRNWAKMGRTYDLRKHYGIDESQYNAILNAQGGVCAICGAPPKDNKKRRLAVDHNHATGKNRGLLCAPCNHAVERLENDPDWGTKALNYLARYIEQTVKA